MPVKELALRFSWSRHTFLESGDEVFSGKMNYWQWPALEIGVGHQSVTGRKRRMTGSNFLQPIIHTRESDDAA